MLTTEGKTYIKRYLAGHVPAIAQCIAYGIGSKAESAADTALQFEVGRADITLTSYDFVNDRLVFKGILPEGFTAIINEVALFSQAENTLAGNFGSKLVSTFDSETEEWLDGSGVEGTYISTNTRLGVDSLRANPAASATASYVWGNVLYDFSGNSGADKFVMAYQVANAFVSSVTWRFRTDDSNYYSFTTNTPTSGYKVDTFNKSAAVATGTPDWSSITSIEVRVTSTAGGAAIVDFDGIRIEDTDTINPDYVMVSRELLTTSFSKTDSKTQEVEFTLNVSVT